MFSRQWWRCRNAQGFMRFRLVSDSVSLLLVKAGCKESLDLRSREIDIVSWWEKLQSHGDGFAKNFAWGSMQRTEAIMQSVHHITIWTPCWKALSYKQSALKVLGVQNLPRHQCKGHGYDRKSLPALEVTLSQPYRHSMSVASILYILCYKYISYTYYVIK